MTRNRSPLPAVKPVEGEPSRPLSRSETHDLSMIIRDRAKVLKSAVAARAAELKAKFETQMATIYKWDEDEIWKAAAEAAAREVQIAKEKIAKRCAQLGIPERYAPSLDLTWAGRGENALEQRRRELRSAADAIIAAMSRKAEAQIDKQSLDLRTQVVAMGLLSPESKLFLESLATVEEAMAEIEFTDVEKQLDAHRDQMRRIGRY